MKYGYCTGFSTSPYFKLGLDLLDMIRKQGFDYVEFPLMNFSNMKEREFASVLEEVKRHNLTSPVACNFFPGSVKLVGREMDKGRIAAYLDEILPKLERLGIEKIILGSGPARTYGPDQTREQALDQFISVIEEVILPRTKAFGIVVCIEPFERTYCNLIVSVMEGMDLVNAIGDPGFELMIDIYHMLSNGESLDSIRKCFPHVKHVHIAGPDRRVPELNDNYIYRALKILKELGYDETMSYETELPKSQEHLAQIFKKTKDLMSPTG